MSNTFNTKPAALRPFPAGVFNKADIEAAQNPAENRLEAAYTRSGRLRGPVYNQRAGRLYRGESGLYLDQRHSGRSDGRAGGHTSAYTEIPVIHNKEPLRRNPQRFFIYG